MRIKWFTILFYIMILFLFILFFKKIIILRNESEYSLNHYSNIFNFGSNVLKQQEGFIQKEKFLVKTNKEIYDPFYVEIYDEINKTPKRIKKELSIITNITQADYDHSYFLDIGSGTGFAVNELSELGYNAFGIDQSKAMIEYSEKKYPSSQYKCGDVEEPLMFDNGNFTHVLCLYYTIYQFKDKAAFFRNCYHWLQPGGYMIIHLVEPDKFDMSIPSAKHFLFGSPKKINDERNKDSIVDFSHFQYKSSFNDSGSQFIHTETFKDKKTNHIRQNEEILYIDKIQDILYLAMNSGFTLKSKVDLKSSMMDQYQYLYFFERML